MDRYELALFHESVSHGTMRFHLTLHEFSSDPADPWRIHAHWHKEYELLSIIKGSGVAHVNNRRFDVSSGDILFINSGSLHSLQAEPGIPLDFYAACFGRELLDSYGNDDIRQNYIQSQASGRLLFRDHFRTGEPAWENLHPPMEEIRQLGRKGLSGNELLIKADLLRIWHFLCQYPATSVAPVHRNEDAKILLAKEILQYIQNHYSKNLSLGELATRFHMSEGQFCRFFKSQVNMTAMEYLNFYRIGIACDLLQSGTTPVSTIALDCGYNNISYFNRMFRKYMHCTPKEYRTRTASFP